MLSFLSRRLLSKVKSVDEALEFVKSDMKLLVGGFGLCGIPETLIHHLSKRQVNNLTIVSNNAGIDNYGLGILLKNNQVKRMMSSYVGENKFLEQEYMNGNLELELIPQGTLVERIRAGGAGIPAFYTRTGVGTLVEYGGIVIKNANHEGGPILSQKKNTFYFNDIKYLMEEALIGDVSLIKGWKADMYGNVIFQKSAQNFNKPMAKSSKMTIVEVEEIVQDHFNPDSIHLQHVYVDHIVLSTINEKRIEKKTVKKASTFDKNQSLINRNIIVQRAACELQPNMIVNLGIGMPMLISSLISDDKNITFQSENGILGLGPYPTVENVDPEVINAGKETVTLQKGGSFFSSDESFSMIRGGHVHLSILGSMQVSEEGDIANWIIPNKMVKGMGGAMDLVSSLNTEIIVTMEHCSKDGLSKLLKKCTLPITGQACVKKLITEKGVFEFEKGQLPLLIEKRKDIELNDIMNTTEFTFKVDENLKPMKNIISGEI